MSWSDPAKHFDTSGKSPALFHHHAIGKTPMVRLCGGTAQTSQAWHPESELSDRRPLNEGGFLYSQNIGGVGKQMAFLLVERGSKVRSMHLPSVSAANLRPALKAQIDAENTRLMTDGEGQYRLPGGSLVEC